MTAQLIEASAGTGKTFRIANAVLRLVAEAGRKDHDADGVPIDRMVVLTFTKAATAELRERVRRRLREALSGLEAKGTTRDWSAGDALLQAWVDGTPEAVRAARVIRLRRALRDFDLAGIATLHSLCQQVLRHNALRSGWLLDATVEADLPDLVDDLATDFWTRLVHDADPSVLPALESAGVTLARLKALARRASDPELEIVPTFESLGEPPDRLPDLAAWVAAKHALAAVWAPDQVWSALSDGAVVVHAREPRSGLHHSLPRGSTTSKAWTVRRELNGPRPSPADALPDAFAAFGPDSITRATRPGQSPPRSPELDAMAEFIAAHQAVQARVGAVIHGARHRLVRAVRTELGARARDRSRRSYDDLLVDLRDALRRTGGRTGPLATAVRGQFHVALIDEFQDTDPIQWEIFRTLFADRRLLLVGDPKQAIYGFRGADVFTYSRAKADPEVKLEAPMGTSYRSDPELHRAVYGLFDRPMPFGLGGPALQRVEPARAESRLVDDSRPPLQLRVMPSGPAARQRWAPELIARGWLADRVPRLVACDVARELARAGQIRGDDGRERTVSASDCAVLVRTNAEAKSMQQALRALGIPGVLRSRSSVLHTRAASDVTALLAATLDPSDAGAIRRALAGRLMGRTAVRIASLLHDPEALSAEVSPFHTWGRIWREEGVSTMLRAVLDDDGALPRLLRQAGGQRFVTDLLHLAELLPVVATTRGLGPAGLLRWMQDGGPGIDEDATRMRLEDDADAVRIITMHSAKGLEWGFVWCPYLWDGVWLGGADKQHLVFHDDRNQHRRTLDLGSADRDRHTKRVLAEQLEEYLRMVYVSLTRAKHRCVVYWGPASDTSPLAYLLFPKVQLQEWRPFKVRDQVRRPDPALLGDLTGLAGGIPGLEIAPVTWAVDLLAPPWTASAHGDPSQGVRRITRAQGPDRAWRRTSYTGLARDRRHLVQEQVAEVELPAWAQDDILLADVAGGAAFGSALHAVFEHQDFTQRSSLRERVSRELTAFGLRADPDLVTESIGLAIDTPLLSSGLRLADVERSRRLDEVDFTFPVRGGFDPSGVVTTAALAEVYRSDPATPDGWVDAVMALGFEPIRGFLTGSIDLVFEHDGRWYLADYKSNKLGTTWAAYAAEHLPGHMVGSAYILQAHLYTVALHRMLSRRLVAYDYDAHMGGCFYLYLRGMHPDLGPRCGIWADRPSRALVAALDGLLCGGAP